MRFDKDGNTLWGEQGISVFEFPEGSYGCSKVKLQAGTDGGIWVLTDDFENTYLRYINADGTLNPTITISDEDSFCMFDLMTPGANETVFVTYKKMSPKDSPITSLNNEIWVASYNIDGTTATAPVQLMESKFFDQAISHYMIPDGIGGGYAYICNDYIEDSILYNNNVYVFHFDANGQSTISDLKGIAVHSFDEENYYTEPYATVDPITHDIILVYFQVPIIVDPYDEHPELRILTNRITTTGEVLWGEGKLIDDNEGEKNFLYPTIDIYPDGRGFMIMYEKAYSIASNFATLEAYGYDMDANQTWHTQMCSVLDIRHFSENTTGFHNGQNIIAWTSEIPGNNGLIGQNIDMNGQMGPTASVPENTMSAEIFQNGNSLIVSTEGLSQVEIISITGQSIKTVKADGDAAEINVSGMTRGLYIVRMNDMNGNVLVKKTVIR